MATLAKDGLPRFEGPIKVREAGHGICPKCRRVDIGTIGYVLGGAVGMDGLHQGGRLVCAQCAQDSRKRRK